MPLPKHHDTFIQDPLVVSLSNHGAFVQIQELIILQYRNLPNILTCIRLIGGAIFLPLTIFYFLPYQISWLTYLIASLFFFFSMTDFLDGYLARRYGLESPLGIALDPIADKFLVCSALIALLAIQKIYFMWVIILIGREIAMLSLRQIATLHDIKVPVSYLGKIKACLQMFLIMILILEPVHNLAYFNFWFITRNILLFLTLYFSLISFYRYAKLFTRFYLQLL